MKKILLLFLFLTGCGSRQHNQMHVPHPHDVKRQQRVPQPAKPVVPKKKQTAQEKKERKPTRRLYTLIVEGLECPVCRQAVAHHLAKIEGISNVRCIRQDQLCHSLELSWNKKENLPLGSVLYAIEKEDFVLHQLHGSFGGSFTQIDKKKLFRITGTGEPFAVTKNVSSSAPVSEALWQRAKQGVPLMVTATIWRDPEDRVYKLALDS